MGAKVPEETGRPASACELAADDDRRDPLIAQPPEGVEDALRARGIAGDAVEERQKLLLRHPGSAALRRREQTLESIGLDPPEADLSQLENAPIGGELKPAPHGLDSARQALEALADRRHPLAQSREDLPNARLLQELAKPLADACERLSDLGRVAPPATCPTP